MHEVAEGDIDVISQPTALFTQPGELNTTDLYDANTTLAKNRKENGYLTPLGTQPYLPKSPLTDAFVAPNETLTCPCVEAGNSTHLASAEYLLEARIKGAYNMIYGVYQEWVH